MSTESHEESCPSKESRLQNGACPELKPFIKVLI
jgi:hypothetical protein